MAVTVAVSLKGALTPQLVQVVVGGLAIGDAYTVTGHLGSWSWPVRGGTGVASSAQVVLYDAAAPINALVTYSVDVNETTTVTSSSITVPWDDPLDDGSENRYFLGSLDGKVAASFLWDVDGFPEQGNVRQSLYSVAGRRSPVVVFDLPLLPSRQMQIITYPAQSAALRALLALGAPVLLRTDGSVIDCPPVAYYAITAYQGKVFTVDGQRVWTLSMDQIDDPEPNTPLVASSWADFDAYYADKTWAQFTAEWAGKTWAEFDRVDWTTRA